MIVHLRYAIAAVATINMMFSGLGTPEKPCRGSLVDDSDAPKLCKQFGEWASLNVQLSQSHVKNGDILELKACMENKSEESLIVPRLDLERLYFLIRLESENGSAHGKLLGVRASERLPQLEDFVLLKAKNSICIELHVRVVVGTTTALQGTDDELVYTTLLFPTEGVYKIVSRVENRNVVVCKPRSKEGLLNTAVGVCIGTPTVINVGFK